MSTTSSTLESPKNSHESLPPSPKIPSSKLDYLSPPIPSRNCTLPPSTLEFNHSYSYSCLRPFNLCVPDPDTLIFSSGVFLHIFNTKTGNLTFQRSSTGYGIGHLTKNPLENHLAVGETGENPPIIIYTWPSLEIVKILEKGTLRNYSHLSYSPDGKLLLSQGSSPDFSITIWNWKTSLPLLQCKSHGQDIYNAIFSPTVTGSFVTSGSSHIKFWKISRTFTGLKLEGVLGKFGRTEISDIIGLYPMPDEKVISGCEWGNILIWEAGVIKLEVRRKNNKPCHQGMITQFEYHNGDLMSMGMDGWIRVWSYETIDQTDASDEKGFIEIEPINEVQMSQDDSSSRIMSLEKRYEDPENREWYGQDGNGGLWRINLGILDGGSDGKCKRLFKCHSGPVMDMSFSSWGRYLVTVGEDGYVHFYDYGVKKLVGMRKFGEGGCSVVWLPCSVDVSGSGVVCGFKSGVVRVVSVDFGDSEGHEGHAGEIRLIQVIKPHTNEITTMTLIPEEKLLITGSKDSTIFLFTIETNHLTPIGFIRVPSAVTCITHKPASSMILIGCSGGHFGEIEFNKLEIHDERKTTYELNNHKSTFFKFKSIKSEIKREIVRREIEEERVEKMAAMRDKMAEYKAINPGIEVDEEMFLEELEEPRALPDVYVPEVPNQVLNINYTDSGTIWLTMGGYDAGYVYEYPNISGHSGVIEEPEVLRATKIQDGDDVIEEPEVLKATKIQDGDDLELQSCFIYEEYIFFGLENGELRVCRVNKEDFTDFSDYIKYPVHDYYQGEIKKILLSHDEGFLFTCGADGNIFSFVVNFEGKLRGKKFEGYEKFKKPELEVEDVRDDHLSLEEVIVRDELNRIMGIAEKNKEEMLKVIEGMTRDYQGIMERNKGLVKSQQIPVKDFVLDERISEDLNRQLKAEMELINEKMAFKVEKSKLSLRKLMEHFVDPITCLPFAVSRISKPDTMIHSVNEKKLGEDFQKEYDYVINRILEAKNSKKDLGSDGLIIVHKPENRDEEIINEDDEKSKIDNIANFLQDHKISPDSGELTVEMRQMLRRYNIKKSQIEKRQREWKKMYSSKPDPNCDHPDDIEMIETAKKTIGDYKLKISSDYVSDKGGETTLTKYKQLLDCKKKCHYLRETFNERLKSIRDRKLHLQNEVYTSAEKKLNLIHSEIPKNCVKKLREIREIDISLEYPENNLEMEKYISMSEKVKEARRQKQSTIDEIMEKVLDEEFRTLIPNEALISYNSDFLPKSLNSTEKNLMKPLKIPDHLQKLLKTSENPPPTPWEREMETIRLSRKLYEQDCIINHIETICQEIDKDLDDLEDDRLHVHADGIYSELYKLTLHQELVILQDSEEKENLLRQKVEDKSQEMAVASHNLQLTLKTIEKSSKRIKNMQNNLKEQSTNFIISIQDNKYSKYLTKIFKKRIKTRMTEDTSSDSSDDTSDDEDDDDGDSVDIHKLALTTLDENICPQDCSKDLYNLAFSLRLKRHEEENLIREEQKNVEALMREVDYDSKKIKLMENSLKDCKQKLHEYMYDKQCRLNDIDMTLLMKFHQLQHFIDDDHLEKMMNCVIFDKTKLSRLYTRVGELQMEMTTQKMMHNKNCDHLRRMNIDIKFMNGRIRELRGIIKEEMRKKFGCTISIIQLYENVIRRLVYEVKGNSRSDDRLERQIDCFRKKYEDNSGILEKLIRDNTEKLSVLTVLSEEMSKFRGIIRRNRIGKGKTEKIDWKKDLERLEKILEKQKEQKEFFKNDVRNLKLKVRSLPPISSRRKLLGVDKVEEEMILERELKVDEEKKRISGEDDDSGVKIARSLLMKMMKGYLEVEEAGEIVDEFFAGISNFSMDFFDNFLEILEKIEKKIEECGECGKIRDIVMDSGNEMMELLEIESRGIGVGSVEISWNVKPKIEEFLDSLEIKKDDVIQGYVMKFLRMDNGVDIATDYVINKLPIKPDSEGIFALREHASRTLRDIQRDIEESETETTVQSSNSGV